MMGEILARTFQVCALVAMVSITALLAALAVHDITHLLF